MWGLGPPGGERGVLTVPRPSLVSRTCRMRTVSWRLCSGPVGEREAGGTTRAEGCRSASPTPEGDSWDWVPCGSGNESREDPEGPSLSSTGLRPRRQCGLGSGLGVGPGAAHQLSRGLAELGSPV